MSDEARTTLRNAVLVLIHRGAQVAGGVGFAALVPRLMGPEEFGRYAFVTSVAFLFALLSGCGFTSVTTRYLPRILAGGEAGTLRRFVGNLLTLRVASGAAAAALYLLIGLGWWPDLGGTAGLVRPLAAGAVLVVFGALMLAEPVVALLFGAGYEPVADNLLPLSLALLALTLGSVPGLLAHVHERPGAALAAATIRLAVFWSLGPLLIAWWGSLGACVSVLLATAAHTAYLTWRLRDVGGAVLGHWAAPVGLGALLLPAVLLRTSSPANALLYGAVVVAYGGGLLLLGVVTRDDVARLIGALRRSAVVEAPGGAS